MYHIPLYDFFDHRKSTTDLKMDSAHFHDHNELYYLVQGKTKYFVENELFFLEPGDIILIPKDTFHKTDSEEQKSVERLLIVFEDKSVESELHEFLEEFKKIKHIRIPKDVIYKFENIFSGIEKETKDKDPEYQLMQKLYLNELLNLLSRYKAPKNTARLNSSYASIQNAAKYISIHCYEDLSLGRLAKMHAMSPSHFSRQFKSITGVGLNEYINISRILMAEKLLVNSKLSITEVAVRCGFNDSNYFAAVFKKIKGITPKKYALLNKK